MDPATYQHGVHYNYHSVGDSTLSTPNMAMAPPMQTQTVRLSTGSEGELSFNDSGYFSSPQAHQFTALSSHQRGSTMAQQSQNSNHSPTKAQGSVVGDLMGIPQPSWQDDFPNVDEWDKNFINTFEENLFGIDSADLNTMVEGIMASPFKSPTSSPRQSRSAAAGLGLSPFNNLSTSNVMLAGPRRSPARLGGSPFKSPFMSPSPVKSLNYMRTSPVTRQRRLILQSPAHKPDGMSEQFPDLPDFLADIKEEASDDLGVVPFQRTNSFGFTPQDDISSSPPFSSLYGESSLQTTQHTVTMEHQLHTVKHELPDRQQKRLKTESFYNLRSSPAKSENFNSYKLYSPSNKRSPARLAQGRISITQHTQLINTLPPKDALRMVRARFTEVLQRATADAVIKEKKLKSKVKSSAKKPQQYPEISQALSKPVSASSSSKQSYKSVPSYTRVQTHQHGSKRQQEILPKPPEWQQRAPCKIVPKKRKR